MKICDKKILWTKILTRKEDKDMRKDSKLQHWDSEYTKEEVSCLLNGQEGKVHQIVDEEDREPIGKGVLNTDIKVKDISIKDENKETILEGIEDGEKIMVGTMLCPLKMKKGI